MDFACCSRMCVTGSSLPWRAPLLGPRSTRSLASSASHVVANEVAMLRQPAGCCTRPSLQVCILPSLSKNFANRCRTGVLNRFVMQKRRPVSMAMVPPPDDVTFDTTFWLGVASTGALAFGIFRAVVYFNVQVRSSTFCI